MTRAAAVAASKSRIQGKRRVLPIAHTPGKYLLSVSGHPVWPVADPDDEKALARLSEVFGSRLRQTKVVQGKSRSVGGIVASFGEAVEELGALYAHLTERRHVKVGSPRELSSMPGLSVVVTVLDCLTPDFFRQLYVNGRFSIAPGIIAGADLDALRRQVLVRAAASILCGSAGRRRTDILPLFQEQNSTAERLVLRADAAHAEFVEAIREGARVLRISTHSDGIDAFLNPKLTMCPMEGHPATEHGPGAPYCRSSGICHRHERPIADVVQSPLVVSPDVARAQVLLFDVCWGVSPKGRSVDPQWTLGRRLIENPAIGAVVTPWNLVISGPDVTSSLAAEIEQGQTLGRSVARFNRSPQARRRGYCMALFGDPRTRVSALTSASHLRPSIDSQPVRRHRNHSRVAQLNFIGMYLAKAATQLDARSLAPAQKAMDEFTSVLMSAGRKATKPDSGSRLRRAILDFVFVHGSVISRNWTSSARSWHAARIIECPSCGESANRLVAELDLLAPFSREITICAICGLVRDVPVGLKVSAQFDRSRRTIDLVGELPKADWTSDVSARSEIRLERHANARWDWPREKNGKPQRFRLPKLVRPGPFTKIAVTYMQDMRLAVFSFPYRVGMP